MGQQEVPEQVRMPLTALQVYTQWLLHQFTDTNDRPGQNCTFTRQR